MVGYEINALRNTLEEIYSGEFVMSYSGLFNKAFNDGLISMMTLNEARNYYGRFWNYVGD